MKKESNDTQESYEFKIVKLDFKSPLHLGDIGVDLLSVKKYWHSDGLFSALFNAFAVLFPDSLEEIVQTTENNFSITSAFPYRKGKLYFPAPKIKFVEDKVYLEYRKKIKKLEFFSHEQFQKVINLDRRMSKEELEGIFQNLEGTGRYEAAIVTSYKRNKINRLTSTTLSEDGLYEIGALDFTEKDSGLWFGVRCSKEFFERYFEPALRFLQDQGLGGDHTAGFGQFKYQFDEMEFDVPENPQIGISLSAILPTQNDLEKVKNFNKLNWDFIIRGGYPFFSFQRKTNTWKPQIMMIKEGSILPIDVKGRLLKLNAGDYKAYHYGKAFMLPTNSNIEI